MLPDVVEDREPSFLSDLGDRIEEGVVSPTAGGQLDPDRAPGSAALDLLHRMIRVVRVDHDVRPDQ
jgi:hypothetical protein